MANKFIPHKEFILPTLIEENECPDKKYEEAETYHMITNSLDCLTNNQKLVVSMAYGIGLDTEYPVNKICKVLDISRVQCGKILDAALKKMKCDISIDSTKNI